MSKSSDGFNAEGGDGGDDTLQTTLPGGSL